MNINIYQENFWSETHENHFNDWLKGLSFKENEAVYMYMYHWHKNMNSSVRENNPDELSINLSKAIQSAPTVNGRVFRGGSRIPNLTKGDTYVYNSFLSTSLNPHIAAKFMNKDKVFYQIDTSVGGAPMASDMKEEEILLDYGHEFYVENVVHDVSLKIFYPETDYCVLYENITFIHLQH